jgi:hypothetical protein
MEPNDMRDVDDWIWKEVIMACFQVISQSYGEVKKSKVK